MEKISKTFYYKRDLEKHSIMSRNIKNLKVGDVITFFGHLYNNKSYTKPVANTIIQYKILLINSTGVLIETGNKYTFPNGTIHFIGNVFSSNFDIENNVVKPYTIKSSMLLFDKGTNHFRNGYGCSKYKITGNGIGETKIYLDLIK